MSVPESRSPASWLLGQIPTVLVLAGIAAVAIWGMSTNWKIASHGGDDREKKTDWCDTHNVPEDICVECDDKLMPKGEPFGFCKTHGVFECLLEHPELAQLPSSYVVTETDRERASASLSFAPRPVNDRRDHRHERRVQFASQEAFDRSGVDVARAYLGKIAETADVHGEITHDPGRVAHVSSRATGTVWRVFKHLGEPVHENELLALVEAAPVGQAKADYQHWLSQLDIRLKTRGQIDAGVVPAPTVLTADSAIREVRIKLASARQSLINLGLILPTDDFKGLSDEQVAERLHFLGVPADDLKSLDSRTTSNNLLPVRAPIGGVITSRDVVAGEVVEPTKLLFEIVDNSVVWLTVGVRAEDVAKLQLGKTPVRFEPDGQSQDVEGTIAWISNEADHKSRTVKVRVNLRNEDGKLRANTFGHGQVILREEKAILVPNIAVHVEGGNYYAFVRDKNFDGEKALKVFHTRSVRIGAKDERNTEIIAGVLPGELVATKNSATMMAELLRGKIGPGCCCGH